MIKGLTAEQVLRFVLSMEIFMTIYRNRRGLGYQTIMRMKFRKNICYLTINKHVALFKFKDWIDEKHQKR